MRGVFSDQVVDAGRVNPLRELAGNVEVGKREAKVSDDEGEQHDLKRNAGDPHQFASEPADPGLDLVFEIGGGNLRGHAFSLDSWAR